MSGVLALKGEAQFSVAEAEKAVELLAGEDEANLRLISARTGLASAYLATARLAIGSKR